MRDEAHHAGPKTFEGFNPLKINGMYRQSTKTTTSNHRDMATRYIDYDEYIVENNTANNSKCFAQTNSSLKRKLQKRILEQSSTGVLCLLYKRE